MGRNRPTYDGVALPTFSPDSKHYAFICLKKDVWSIVCDGVEGKAGFVGFLKDSSIEFDSPTHFHIFAMQVTPVGTNPELKYVKLVVDIK